MDLDTRRLRVFLTVAEELHFSRAAERLHISQPALSQQIRVLEDELGVALFARTSRQVELTPAGHALVAAAPRALYELDRTVDITRATARGVVGSIVVGSVRTGLADLVPRILRAFSEAHPDVRMHVVHEDTSALLRDVHERRIDAAVVRAAASVAHLHVETLVSEPLMLAIPAHHPLAELTEVDPHLLAGERFVSWPRHLGADFFDLVIAYCRSHGFSPWVAGEGDDIDTQLALVAAGAGVSMQPAFYAAASPSGVVFRPLTGDTPEVALQLAWRQDAGAIVALFVEQARAMSASLIEHVDR